MLSPNAYVPPAPNDVLFLLSGRLKVVEPSPTPYVVPIIANKAE